MKGPKGMELLPLIKASSKADRFSENLMKWVRKHRDVPLVVAYSPVSYVDGEDMGDFDVTKTCTGSLYIGFGGLDNGWLHGARLSEILCSGVGASEFAYGPKYRFQLLPDWWQHYIAGGKCFIDPEHLLYADRERWEVADDGRSRRCSWCGDYYEYSHTEFVPKKSWKPMPPRCESQDPVMERLERIGLVRHLGEGRYEGTPMLNAAEESFGLVQG